LIDPEAKQVETSPDSRPVVLHTRVVTGTGGGPDKTILNSGRFLDPLGYACICAYMHPHDDTGFETICEKASQSEARILSVPDRGMWNLPRVARTLLKICRSEQVTIWHAHDYKSNALGILLKRFHRMKLVTTVHGWETHTRRTPLYYWVDRRCLPYYDHVICVSGDLHEACLRAGVNKQRLSLIHNAIDIEDFQKRETTDVAKAAMQLPPDRIVIGAMGRLSEEKGFDQLLRATKRLVDAGHPIHTVIIGEGPQRPKLEQLIMELNLQGHAQLAGFRANVKSCFEAMDVFALSSSREGLPNVVLEAMSMSVPVVATRVAGIPELITHGRNGLVVDTDNDAQFADGLRQLVADAELRQALAAQARQVIVDRFSFTSRMAQVATIYQSIT